ncbi:MAG: STM4014 family protein [Lachnospiraceae bacterium]
MAESRNRPLILIGDQASKGVEYFMRAARERNCPVEFIRMPYGSEITALDISKFRGRLVKLDPPRYQSADLLGANDLIAAYQTLLYRFLQADDIEMLNAPQAILQTLDKQNCKKILQGTGVAVTPVLAKEINDMKTLRDVMQEQRKYRVFIKPVCGSGAGGVLAYQINPRNGREVLYTSACLKGEALFNTKKLRKYEKPEEIQALGDMVLGAGAIVEEWLQKARYCGKSYDLRVVWQFGRIQYMVARCSGGPITNLHLNNDALDVRALGLTAAKTAEIEQLCRSAVQAFNGLRVAGIDVLLTPGALRPYIIEINAQGDLIYQDIYHENTIYRAQVEYLENYMTDGGLHEQRHERK